MAGQTDDRHDEELLRLKRELWPFADVARWMERNGHNPDDIDFVASGLGGEIMGLLRVQSADFILAAQAIGDYDGHG